MKFEPYMVRYKHNQDSSRSSEFFAFCMCVEFQWGMTVGCRQNQNLPILQVNLGSSLLDNEKVNKVNPKISTEKEKEGQSKTEDRVSDCATKEEIAKLATKESVQELKESVQELKGSVEKLEVSVKDELVKVLKHEIARLEKKGLVAVIVLLISDKLEFGVLVNFIRSLF